MSPSFDPSNSRDGFGEAHFSPGQEAIHKASQAFESALIDRTLSRLIAHLSPARSFIVGSQLLIADHALRLSRAASGEERDSSLSAWASNLNDKSRASFRASLQQKVRGAYKEIEDFWADRAAVYAEAEHFAARFARWRQLPEEWDIEIMSMESSLHESQLPNLHMVSEYAQIVSSRIEAYAPKLDRFLQSAGKVAAYDGLDAALSHWGLARAARDSEMDRASYRTLFLELPYQSSTVESHLDPLRRTAFRPAVKLGREISPLLANKTHFYQFLKSAGNTQRIEAEINSVFGL